MSLHATSEGVFTLMYTIPTKDPTIGTRDHIDGDWLREVIDGNSHFGNETQASGLRADGEEIAGKLGEEAGASFVVLREI